MLAGSRTRTGQGFRQLGEKPDRCWSEELARRCREGAARGRRGAPSCQDGSLAHRVQNLLVYRPMRRGTGSPWDGPRVSPSQTPLPSPPASVPFILLGLGLLALIHGAQTLWGLNLHLPPDTKPERLPQILRLCPSSTLSSHLSSHPTKFCLSPALLGPRPGCFLQDLLPSLHSPLGGGKKFEN